MKKQTAVEWMIKSINARIDLTTLKYWNEIENIVNQAKEMEKEQILQALNDGKLMALMNIENKSLEQYYKENYQKEEHARYNYVPWI